MSTPIYYTGAVSLSLKCKKGLHTAEMKSNYAICEARYSPEGDSPPGWLAG